MYYNKSRVSWVVAGKAVNTAILQKLGIIYCIHNYYENMIKTNILKRVFSFPANDLILYLHPLPL